jgi:hypothetical protein
MPFNQSAKWREAVTVKTFWRPDFSGFASVVSDTMAVLSMRHTETHHAK